MVAIKVTPPSQTPARAVLVQTMGCKVNLFESELIQNKLDRLGYQRSRGEENPRTIVINTCTVTGEADRQARQLVRKAIRNNPDAWVVVTGCYAQTDPQACAAIPGVDLVVGNARKLEIPSLLAPLYEHQLPRIMVGDIDHDISLPDQLVNGFEGKSRAFVQIQQGCDQGCTFCIIHTARGPNRSFSPAMVRRQVERLVINGYREIVMCGVDIGSYGNDFGSPVPLADLLADLVTIEGDFRLRLSSIDPAHLTDALIAEMASSSKICPQLHLSLQSGNTLILKRMKRRADRELIYERIGALKAAVPELVLSADILVGFPTEEESHFSETLQAIEDLDIAFPHVFSYSPRPGTPAARIPRQVAASDKKARAKRARAVGQQVWHRIADELIGTRQRILIENSTRTNPDTTGKRLSHGRLSNYYPVLVDHSLQLVDGWQQVEITGVGDDALFARPVSQEVQYARNF